MKRCMALFLILALAMLGLPAVMAADNPQVASISLANNTAFYNNADRPLTPLRVAGILPDGTTVDLTGNSNLTYASGNPGTFYFEGNQLASASAAGYAVVRAVYKNPDGTKAEAKLYLQKSTCTVAGNSTFENLTDTTVSESAVYLAGIPGHDGKKAGATSGKGYVGESWKTYNQGLRAAQGWFYDSGEKTNANAALSINVTLGWQREIGIVDSSSDHYGVRKNGTTLVAQTQASRTRGWHQVAVIYDSSAKLAVIYVDGEEVLKESFSANVNSPAGGDRFYFFGSAYKDTDGNFYESIYDDISVTNLSGGYKEQVFPHTVTVNTTAGGQVKNGATVLSDGDTIEVENGSDLTLSLLPDEGFEIAGVLLNGSAAQVSNQSLLLTNITADQTVSVEFREREVTPPTIAAGGEAVIDSAYVPQEGGAPVFSALLYCTVNHGYGWDVKEIGVEVKNEAGVILPLPVLLENVTADGRFGLRVYGSGLLAGGAYSMTPYVKIQRGTEEKNVTGTPKSFTVV